MANENSYCTVAEVEARAQVGAYGASTVPTLTQVGAFMDQRTGEVYGWMAEVSGDAAPGPTAATDYQVKLSVTSGAGYALGRTLALAVALASAADALQAAGAASEPAMSERVVELLKMFYDLK